MCDPPHTHYILIFTHITGYAKTLRFNKHTGELTGFGYMPECFNTEEMFAKRVNCFVVSSPEARYNLHPQNIIVYVSFNYCV